MSKNHEEQQGPTRGNVPTTTNRAWIVHLLEGARSDQTHSDAGRPV
jgi:hypothetical protein